MSNAVATLSDIERMAVAVANSGLFGVKNADQAMALMLIAQAEGRHPALAARDYDIIQGRPSKKSEAMLRDFLESGGKVEWHRLDDKTADASFSHPAGGTIRIEWTMARAAQAGMGGKDMWKKYPRQMLRARCVSEGIRTVCPMATSGMYVPEEVHDFAKEKDVTPPRITPTAGADERVTPERRAELDELGKKVTEFLNQDQVADAVMEIENAAPDADEKTYLWTLFDSKQRSAMKKEVKRQRDEATAKAQAAAIERTKAAESGVINESQRKRLEARITEAGLDRDQMKQYCFEQFSKEHFAELTQTEYNRVDSLIEDSLIAGQV